MTISPGEVLLDSKSRGVFSQRAREQPQQKTLGHADTHTDALNAEEKDRLMMMIGCYWPQPGHGRGPFPQRHEDLLGSGTGTFRSRVAANSQGPLGKLIWVITEYHQGLESPSLVIPAADNTVARPVCAVVVGVQLQSFVLRR